MNVFFFGLKLSKTALAISAKFNVLRKQEHLRFLVPDEIHQFYDMFYPKKSRFALCSWLKERMFMAMLWVDEKLLAGDLHHILFRKISIYTQTLEFIEQHTDAQIVVLGSGFDHLAWVFSTRTTCFELDVPAVIQQKKMILGESRELLHFVEWNANSDSLADVLSSNTHFNSNYPTLFITEGLIDYLTFEVLERVIRSFKTLNPRNDWLTTHFDREQLSWLHRLSFELGVRLAGEKLTKNLNAHTLKDLYCAESYTLKHESSTMDLSILNIQGLPMACLRGCRVLHLN